MQSAKRVVRGFYACVTSSKRTDREMYVFCGPYLLKSELDQRQVVDRYMTACSPAGNGFSLLPCLLRTCLQNSNRKIGCKLSYMFAISSFKKPRNNTGMCSAERASESQEKRKIYHEDFNDCVLPRVGNTHTLHTCVLRTVSPKSEKKLKDIKEMAARLLSS